MTRDGQWRAAGAQPNDGVRPLTSAGPRSTRTEIVDPADLKTDVDRPEVPSRKVKQGKPSKRKQQADPEERDQQPLLDGYRHVATFLRADERRLHEQLLIASEKGNHRAIYLLLSQQVIDKDRCQGMQGYSPLHHAAARGHLEVLELLLEFGWRVDARNDALETALHLACYSGHANIVECLLDRGADVNARTRDLDTPLFYAARKSRYRIVRLLARRECDLGAKNRYGDVAEEEAVDEKTQAEFATANEESSRLNTASTRPAASTEKGERVISQQHREKILAFLDVRSLGRASMVSFRWHRAADSPALWKKLGVSRWELLLHASMGLGSITPMGMLTARRTRDKNSANGNQRPTSCDQSSTRFLMPRIHPKRLQASVRDDTRPQTARNVRDISQF